MWPTFLWRLVLALVLRLRRAAWPFRLAVGSAGVGLILSVAAVGIDSGLSLYKDIQNTNRHLRGAENLNDVAESVLVFAERQSTLVRAVEFLLDRGDEHADVLEDLAESVSVLVETQSVLVDAVEVLIEGERVRDLRLLALEEGD